MTKITRKTGCTPWRAERRLYPVARSWSTADYVAAFFHLNSGTPSGTPGTFAYDRAPYVDHLALYQPLSTRLQEWPEGQDSGAARRCTAPAEPVRA